MTEQELNQCVTMPRADLFRLKSSLLAADLDVSLVYIGVNEDAYGSSWQVVAKALFEDGVGYRYLVVRKGGE